MLFLFYGFGAEYVLRPIYEVMKTRGFNCIEIDALSIQNSTKKIKSLIHMPITYITSAHFLFDRKNFTDYYKTSRKFYSVLEIIQLLSPIKTIFLPHDLTQPTIDFEDNYLNQLDLFLSPGEPYTTIYSQYCEVKEVGWIKYQPHKQNEFLNKKNKALWLISDYVLHENMGVEKSFTATYPLLKQGVSIKFPVWLKTAKFEAYYQKKGVHVFPSTMNAIELILNHEIIITNGLSSINAESCYLGKTTVNIMEYAHYGDRRAALQNTFPDLIFYEKIVDCKVSEIPKKTKQPTLKTFDMEKAIKLITN